MATGYTTMDGQLTEDEYVREYMNDTLTEAYLRARYQWFKLPTPERWRAATEEYYNTRAFEQNYPEQFAQRQKQQNHD